MLAREEAKTLYMRYHKDRQGLRKEPRMASVCLICGSADVVVRSEAEPYRHYCRNCGFEFLRYRCRLCGEMVDGRDPQTPPESTGHWQTPSSRFRTSRSRAAMRTGRRSSWLTGR